MRLHGPGAGPPVPSEPAAVARGSPDSLGMCRQPGRPRRPAIPAGGSERGASLAHQQIPCRSWLSSRRGRATGSRGWLRCADATHSGQVGIEVILRKEYELIPKGDGSLFRPCHTHAASTCPSSGSWCRAAAFARSPRREPLELQIRAAPPRPVLQDRDSVARSLRYASAGGANMSIPLGSDNGAHPDPGSVNPPRSIGSGTKANTPTLALDDAHRLHEPSP